MTRSALLVLPFVLVLSACAASPGPTAGTGTPPPAAPGADLRGVEWVLEDLAGTGVVDRAEATLSFPEPGKTAGKGSCNRFTGSVTVTGRSIKFGPLATTRMACPPAVGDQESRYLKALTDAERFEVEGTTLRIFCNGLDKPLRFVRRSKP